MSGITYLLEEVLVEMLSFLPKSDLKSARLTCVQWGRLGAEWLFQRVYFAPRQVAMQDFLSIAANPRFSRKVKALVYDARLFIPELATFPTYRQAYAAVVNKRNACGIHIDDWFPEDTDIRSQHIEDHRVNSLVRYVRLLDKQQDLLKEEKDTMALSKGLRHFDKLSKVTICDDFSQFPDRVTESYGDYDWYDQRSAEGFGRAIAPSGWHFGFANLNHWENDIRGIHLFQALAMQCQNIKDLCIGSEQSSALLSIFDLEKQDRKDVCTVARGLETFKLYCHHPGTSSKELFYDCLGDMLSDTSQLRFLVCEGNKFFHLRQTNLAVSYNNWACRNECS